MLNLNYFMCIIFQCSVRGYVICVLCAILRPWYVSAGL